jgi:hypothetical protein
MLHPQDLNEHQAEGAPTMVITKKDSTRDILTIFTPKIRVVFTKKKLEGMEADKNETSELLEGRWCLLCK